MKSKLKKAEELLNRNTQKEIDLVFLGTCIVLSKEYGWKKLRLKRLIDVSADIFTECGANKGVSLVQMCDEETGIEFRNPDGQSWKETPYLNQAKWDAVKDKILNAPEEMQKAYQLRVKQCMNKWRKPLIMSSVALSLHRKEGWGYERIAKFITLLEDCISSYDNEEKGMFDTVFELTGLRYSHTSSNELVLLNAREIEGEE